MDRGLSVDYGPQLNALLWLLISLSGLFLFTRLYLKNCQNRGLWWDDWILLASWIALTAGAGLTTYVINLGYGKKFIPLTNVPYFGLPVKIFSSLMIIANLWGKTSFGVTLLRVPVRWMRICVWCILASLTLALTPSVVMVWAGCSSVGLAGRCVPIDISIRYNVFSCAYSAVVDVALALLPWKYLLNQEMSKKEKIGAMIAMSMGLFAGATAAAKATTIPMVSGSDARGSVPLVALGAAEAAVCIMAASIPILRALARGGTRGRVPRGSETGYPTNMTESGVRTAASLSLPIQVPPAGARQPEGRRNTNTPDSWGETLTTGSTETLGRKGDDDSSDEDTLERARQGVRVPLLVQSPFPESDDDDDDEEDEDACDGGDTCLCGKPAQEHPDHKWIATHACRRKFLGQVDMALFRDPNNFGMHTFTDHEAYGMVEVVENLLLDFVEADSNWREQWVVCETLSFFLQTDLAEALMGIDDSDSLNELIRLVGRTFLSMLALLERERRLAPDSEVKNLGLIMSLYIKLARDLHADDLLEEGKEETVELKAVNGSTTKYTFDLANFDEYILGYAERHGITVPGASQDEGFAEKLPIQAADDPWNTAEAFRAYEKDHGKADGLSQKPAIGGDKYDITTWTSAERSSASMNRRDPFSKKEIEALRLGLMLKFE
ncbi:hypothetical protein C8A00DRAFT_33465 [Chaetomidium leptoderma]|uniref:Rhodopsin domain-containing protein n=1 Tax=Chaetomidium leptoderma TaxID=669021 RepID=A0AAN6VLZ0_9PEZI|nr:hypothetical protein C8A00DRAFT_33465 [Chaetomidium leptoderma]